MKVCCILILFVFDVSLSHLAEKVPSVIPQVGKRVIRSIHPTFVGVTLDTTWIKTGFCNIKWERAIELGQHLLPGFLRIGGTMADYMIFDPQASPARAANKTCDMFPKHHNFTLSKKEVDVSTWFARSVGWKLIWDLNLLLRNSDGGWSTETASQLLDYMQDMGYKSSFELGNEPNLYPSGRRISGSQMAKDYGKCRKLLNNYPLFNASMLIGPAQGEPDPLLMKFLQSKAGQYIDAVTFHHYYGSGQKATVAEMLDPWRLDRLIPYIQKPLKWNKEYSKGLRKAPQVWLGETSSFYGGGAPHLSDRFLAGFMWMDKLGLSAVMGLGAVFRQTFFLGNYALVDRNTDPCPDYFLTVLYKKLIGSGVLKTSLSLSDPKLKGHVRLYAHCDSNRTILYGMNLYPNSSAVTIGEPSSHEVDQYLFEAPDGNLTSKNVLLNGQQLVFGRTLPPMKPVRVRSPMLMPRYSYAFYVFNGKGCP